MEYLKTLPQYDETLIVITGDHEGLATYREELCNAPGGKGIVSDKTFTPFIIVNSPVGMRYDKVMGQIDMYPTLLNLLNWMITTGVDWAKASSTHARKDSPSAPKWRW